MITKDTPTGRYRNALIVEALTIAINSLEYDADYTKAEELGLILADMNGDNN